MADTTLSAEQVSGEQEQPGENGTPAAPAEEPKKEGLESLPDSWQQEIRALRSENADRRTKYNDLKSQLDNAKSQEDIDKAVGEYKTRVVELEQKVSLEHHTRGLSEEAAALVTGSTDEEIKASAERVRALLESAGTPRQTPDLDASGGLDPKDTGSGSNGYNPRELAAAARAANGRRR